MLDDATRYHVGPIRARGRPPNAVTSRGLVEVRAAVRDQRWGRYAGMSWAGATSLVAWVSRARHQERKNFLSKQNLVKDNNSSTSASGGASAGCVPARPASVAGCPITESALQRLL